MVKVRDKQKVKLLHQIVEDLQLSIGVADAAAQVAAGHMSAGRVEEAMQAMLEVEPELYDAQRLFSLSTYVKSLGKNAFDRKQQ